MTELGQATMLGASLGVGGAALGSAPRGAHVGPVGGTRFAVSTRVAGVPSIMFNTALGSILAAKYIGLACTGNTASR